MGLFWVPDAMGQFSINKQSVPQLLLLLVCVSPCSSWLTFLSSSTWCSPTTLDFYCCQIIHCIIFPAVQLGVKLSLLPYPQTIPSNPRRDYGHVSHADKVFLRLSHKTLSQRQEDLQQPRSCLRLHDFFLKIETTPVPTPLLSSIFYWLFFDRDRLCSGFTLERKFRQLISHLLRTSWYQVF